MRHKKMWCRIQGLKHKVWKVEHQCRTSMKSRTSMFTKTNTKNVRDVDLTIKLMVNPLLKKKFNKGKKLKMILVTCWN